MNKLTAQDAARLLGQTNQMGCIDMPCSFCTIALFPIMLHLRKCGRLGGKVMFSIRLKLEAYPFPWESIFRRRFIFLKPIHGGNYNLIRKRCQPGPPPAERTVCNDEMFTMSH